MQVLISGNQSVIRSVSRWDILRKLIFTTANCFLANKIKNDNSLVTSRGLVKCKLKNFP